MAQSNAILKVIISIITCRLPNKLDDVAGMVSNERCSNWYKTQ